MTAPTLLLVHGAWGGSWCWRDFREVLERHEVPSLSVDLPSSRLGADSSTGLREDADAVVRTASSISGPVMLIGHSYGGAVVLEAAPRIPRLERIAFIAALVPSQGQSATDVSREIRVRTRLDEAMLLEGDHLRLDPQLAPQALYNHCDPTTSAWATSQLTMQTISSFREARSSLDLDVTSRYVMCSDDFAIDPSLQEIMASRCNESTTVSSDHSPFLSHPGELFEALMA